MNLYALGLKKKLLKVFGKILPLTLVGTIAFSCGMPSNKTYAYNLEVPTITSQEFEDYEYTKMFLSGRQIEFTKETGAPYTKSKKIMVPLEAFANAFYGMYSFDESTNTAEIGRFGKTINVKAKSKKIIIKDGTEETSLKAKVATTIKKGKVYVQLSTLAKALDLSVRTDKKTGIIHVEHKDNFKNIDFKDKKLITMKSVKKNNVDKLILDMAEVSVDYIDVLKNSNQYKLFMDGSTLYVFSYQMLSHLDYLYGKTKEYLEAVRTKETDNTVFGVKYLVSDDRKYLNERIFLQRVINMIAFDACYNSILSKTGITSGFSNDYEVGQVDAVIKVAKEIANEIKKQNLSEKEEIVLAINMLREKITYGTGYGAYHALIKGQAVCTGYADAFGYVMRELGIPCILVGGDYKGANKHEWNHVYVDGEWYLQDPTNRHGSLEFYYLLFTDSYLAINEKNKNFVIDSFNTQDEIDLVQLTYKFN